MDDILQYVVPSLRAPTPSVLKQSVEYCTRLMTIHPNFQRIQWVLIAGSMRLILIAQSRRASFAAAIEERSNYRMHRGVHSTWCGKCSMSAKIAWSMT